MGELLWDIKISQIVVGGQLLSLTELSRYYFGTKRCKSRLKLFRL